MAAPRALLLDLDGVLRRWPANDGTLETSLGLPAGALRSVAFSASLLSRAITGEITDEEWRAEVAADLMRRHPGVDAKAAVEAWSASPGEVAEDVLQVLDEEASQLRLVLVTNATSRLPRDLTALSLYGRFHAIINSSVVGVAKPQAEIFHAALRAAGCSVDEALFVDDSSTNVQAAQAIGIASHLHHTPNSLRAFLRLHQAARRDPPDARTTLPANVFAHLVAGEIRLVVLPGSGMAHGGATYDVPIDIVPPSLRVPNTALWVELDSEFTVVRAWKRGP